MKRLISAALTAAALTGGALGASPASAASACAADSSCVTSLTISRSTVDLTKNAAVPVTVTATVTSTRSLIGVWFLATTNSASRGRVDLGGQLTRVSGTATNGTYTGTFTLTPGVAGTWTVQNISVADGITDATSVGTGLLAAAGFQTTLHSTVTAAPAVPTSFKAVSALTVANGVVASFSWKNPPATAVAPTKFELATSGSCGVFTWTFGATQPDQTITTGHRRTKLPGLCSGKVRAVNDFGASAWSSTASALI